MMKVILDTDIGDDIDDALALGLICASPEMQLVGVTTVFGNVSARARQARTVLKVAGDRFAAIPVAAGCGATMASRPNHGAKAYLHNTLPNQDSTCLPESQLAPLHPRHAVNFLIDTIMAGDGDIIPITIGALTNMAAALVMERRLVQKIPKIVAMAAEFKEPMAEWNIRCDPEAAHIVFASGIPMDVITFDIGRTVRFDHSHIDQLNRSPRPMASRLAAAIAAWRMAHSHGQTVMPRLFDPMAVATQIQPDLCTWKTGTISVELAGTHTYGFTTFAPSEAGPHRVAWDANREASLDFYLKRILAT
jgi:inosine-uridine nucleoside N-ribohydrolase